MVNGDAAQCRERARDVVAGQAKICNNRIAAVESSMQRVGDDVNNLQVSSSRVEESINGMGRTLNRIDTTLNTHVASDDQAQHARTVVAEGRWKWIVGILVALIMALLGTYVFTGG